MRIAYCCADPGVPVFGTKGCSSHVQSVLAALLRRGDDVALFAARTGGRQPAHLAPVTVHELPRRRGGGLTDQERAAQTVDVDLRTALEEHGPFDLVLQRYSLWSAAGMEYARDTGTVGVLEVNAPLIAEQATYRGLVDRAGAEAVAQRAFAAATAVFAVSEEAAAHIGVPVHVVPNGVVLHRFTPAGHRRRETFTVGFVGSLRPWHGLGTLVEAFALLHARRPHARLLVVGDGPGRGELETAIDARGLSDVAPLTGAVAPTDVPPLLDAMDAAVAPYGNLDGFWFSPLKVFEYMAAGLPIVASRIGQIERVLDHDRTALLTPPGDADAIADALVRLADDACLRARLGRQARAVAEERHGWDAAVDRIIRLAELAGAARG